VTRANVRTRVRRKTLKSHRGGLKRSAAMTNSLTSTKSRPKKQADAEEAGQSVASVAQQAPADHAPDPEDWAADIIRAVLKWQIEQIRMKPSKNANTANRRAKDARTTAELVRTLERLDAVEKRREGKGRKAKPRNDKDIKEEFVRRLDQLLAARDEGSVPPKPERE
jgi:hypothetical protein